MNKFVAGRFTEWVINTFVLIGNVHTLWHLPSTLNSDRQQIIRLRIERVDVVVEGTTEQVDVALNGSGGFSSHHGLIRPVRRYDQTADYDRLKTRIVELATTGNSYAEIAHVLNEEDAMQPNPHFNVP